MRWNAQLPPTLRRAGFEIYQNMRAAGSLTIRDWLAVPFPQPDRGASLWRDLWTLATSLDSRLAEAAAKGGESQVISALR